MSEHGVPHHADNPEHKRIGIFIAVLAVIMAIIAAATNQQANQVIVKEVKASNGFAWYQSKRQRSYMNDLELKRIDFLLAGTVTPAQAEMLNKTKTSLEKKNAEYKTENEEIERLAKADQALAAVAAHKHHWFELGEICLHIAVVLCSLVLLTEQKVFFHVGALVTILGVLLAAYAQFGNHEHHAAHADESKSAATAPATH